LFETDSFTTRRLGFDLGLDLAFAGFDSSRPAVSYATARFALRTLALSGIVEDTPIAVLAQTRYIKIRGTGAIISVALLYVGTILGLILGVMAGTAGPRYDPASASFGFLICFVPFALLSYFFSRPLTGIAKYSPLKNHPVIYPYSILAISENFVYLIPLIKESEGFVANKINCIRISKVRFLKGKGLMGYDAIARFVMLGLIGLIGAYRRVFALDFGDSLAQVRVQISTGLEIVPKVLQFVDGFVHSIDNATGTLVNRLTVPQCLEDEPATQ